MSDSQERARKNEVNLENSSCSCLNTGSVSVKGYQNKIPEPQKAFGLLPLTERLCTTS